MQLSNAVEQFPDRLDPSLNLEIPLGDESFEIESFIFRQFLEERIDLDDYPPDNSMINAIGGAKCARLGVLPWARIGDCAVFFIDNLEREREMRDHLADFATRMVFLPLERQELVHRLCQTNSRYLLRHARHYCPHDLAVRKLYMEDHEIFSASLLFGTLFLMLSYPMIALHALLIFASILVAGNSILRLAAIFRFARHHDDFEMDIECKISDRELPVISILVPLYKESKLIQKVINAITALDYPSQKLDVKLVLEADDDLTIQALEEVKLPPFVETIFVPPDYLRTKPKAMNFTLPFCHGEIIGIYDAEDRPDPGQLREIAQGFHDAHPDVATIQCELCFYNSRQNWFTRCFTIEYRIWFAALLPALQHFNLPVPLGGTSVFFRKHHLKNMGGWDAHNVTEDADLGIRFKRFGLETLVISSKTKEEANSRGISWIRQRSRWLKGYMTTWACHMSRPIRLYRDLGLKGFLATQILLFGAFGNYIAIPLFWCMWPAIFGYDLIGLSTMPSEYRIGLLSIMLFAQAISITVGIIALHKKPHRFLFKTLPTLPIYWLFGAAAAYKALFEVIFLPYYWDKTTHGHAKEDDIIEEEINRDPFREAASYKPPANDDAKPDQPALHPHPQWPRQSQGAL